MKVLIWILMAIFSTKLGHALAEIGSNPYKEALLARPWESEQQYVTVRPGAFMFYWLYYASGKKKRAECKPLIIWIQGGPGYAASGIGNFREIGPLTMDMKPRNHTWVKGKNVLLFDYPVGTGFSYVRNNSLLAKTDQEIGISHTTFIDCYDTMLDGSASLEYEYRNIGNVDGHLPTQETSTDLVVAIEEFFKINPGFRETPTYIIGQSYGGKICPRLAYYLHTAIKNGSLIMNFKGIGIGNGFVDPIEAVSMYPAYLYYRSLINENAYFKTSAIVNDIRKSLNTEDYATAAERLDSLFEDMYEETGGSVNFNNVNEPFPNYAQKELETTMNTYVKPILSHVVNQSREWVYMSGHVYHSMKKYLLLPSTKFLEKVLNETDLKVAIYNSDLDVLTPLAGAMNWVHRLHWNGSKELMDATRHPIEGTVVSFYKEVKQLSFWCVYGAGNWVPEDEPVAMKEILQYLISDDD